jgi:sterol desaturase/sphingolipid hydroxylase (fatty acid hydroxylase superfamily)
MWRDIGLFIGGFAGIHLFSTFVEYWVHILQHRRMLYGKIHTFHHKEGNGQGVWGEFLANFFPASPFIAIVGAATYFIFGHLWLVLGVTLGGIWYAAFSAYTHQLSHERPDQVFWQRFPVHTVHHQYNMWHHNFGVTTLFWDRVFGTYKDCGWQRTGPVKLRNFFDIHWLSPNSKDDIPKPNAAVASELRRPVESAGVTSENNGQQMGRAG